MRVSEPTCTVVVCTRDRPAALERCLRAVRQIEYPRFDVLVVDNAPSKAPAREAAERWAARYVVEPVRGLSRARNRGALVSEGALIAYLDDDAIPEPQWLSALAREFEADPAVVAVTGRIRPLEPCAAELDAFTATVGIREGLARRVINRDTSSWFEIALFGGIGGGTNMAFRRSAFAGWPGFDIRLGRGAAIGGGEEGHAFFSLIDRGFSVAYTPKAAVRHPIPGTLEEIRSAHLRAIATISAYMVFLFFDQPRYRMRLLRYIAGGALAVGRTWRDQEVPRPGRLAPRTQEIRAWLSGPWLFAKSRFRTS